MTLPRKIKTPEDVAKFFNHIAGVERINFHPDEAFHTYGRDDDKGAWVPAYTVRQSDLRDELMAQAWATCNHYGLDIYCMGMWALEKADPRGDGPTQCEDEKEFFFPSGPGVLDWEPES